METLNATLLIKNAREKLAGKDPRTLAAIHAGVTVAAGLVITVLQYALTLGIGKTSGLSGLGTRSILETVQTVLQWANMVLLPFWNLGFLYVALQWARGENPRKEDLLTGFHRVGPCIGLLLNRFVIIFVAIFASVMICSSAYAMLPAGQQLQSQMLATGAVDYNSYMESLTQQDMNALIASMRPVLIVSCAVAAIVLAPVLYRVRLAEYVILDHKEARAFPAMLVSASLLRRRCWQMLKLDLQFWWYYGLKVLLLAICYADSLLAMLGVTLPVNGDVAFLVSYVVYLALLFCVDACFLPRVKTAYACAYDALKEMGPVPKQTKPAVPQKMPLDEQ